MNSADDLLPLSEDELRELYKGLMERARQLRMVEFFQEPGEFDGEDWF